MVKDSLCTGVDIGYGHSFLHYHQEVLLDRMNVSITDYPAECVRIRVKSGRYDNAAKLYAKRSDAWKTTTSALCGWTPPRARMC